MREEKGGDRSPPPDGNRGRGKVPELFSFELGTEKPGFLKKPGCWRAVHPNPSNFLTIAPTPYWKPANVGGAHLMVSIRKTYE